MSASIQTTLRRINTDKNISIWTKYSTVFSPPIDNRSKLRYDLIAQIMEHLNIPRFAFIFNGVNIVCQEVLTGLVYGDMLHAGIFYCIELQPIEFDKNSRHEVLEVINRVFNRAMEETRFEKIRDKYIVGHVDKKTFSDERAELFRGFTLTVDILGDETIVLKHKIVHRVLINQTLDQPGIEVAEGDELQSIYDHKNTYFYEETIDVNIDSYMDPDESDSITYRQYYINKFERKLNEAALKRPLWQQCLRYIQESTATVPMIKCRHTKDLKICMLFKHLTTKVQIPESIIQNISRSSRVSSFDKFNEVRDFRKLLDNNRREGSTMSTLQVLEHWGIFIGEQLAAKSIRSQQPTVAINGKLQRNLLPTYMKDIKLSTPISMANGIGVFYQPGAQNIFQAFWPIILNAIQQKNGGPKINVKTFELSAKNNDNAMRDIRKAYPTQPPTVFVFFLAGDKFYSYLKKTLTGDHLAVTQMIQAQNQRKNLGDRNQLAIICHNIALQILCKLGACPWTVVFPIDNPRLCPSRNLNMLVIGIDVSHGKKRFDKQNGVSIRKSYIGLSAYFMEDRVTTFFGMTIQQNSGQEVLAEGKIMQFLVSFLNKDHFPATVIVFRDGVGKGQIEAIRNHEVKEFSQCLTQGANKFSKSIPEITFVVATKRIQEDFAENDGRKAPDGGLAIIDPLICSENEFYLVNDKRTGFVHYSLIHSTRITREDVIKVAYDTAFTYFNWPGPIKVPASLQYAHTISKIAGERFDKEIKIQNATFNVHRGLMFL